MKPVSQRSRRLFYTSTFFVYLLGFSRLLRLHPATKALFYPVAGLAILAMIVSCFLLCRSDRRFLGRAGMKELRALLPKSAWFVYYASIFSVLLIMWLVP